MGEAIITSRLGHGIEEDEPIQVLPGMTTFVITVKDSNNQLVRNIGVSAFKNNSFNNTNFTNSKGQAVIITNALSAITVSWHDFFKNGVRLLDHENTSQSLNGLNYSGQICNVEIVLSHRSNLLINNNCKGIFLASNYSDYYLIGAGGSAGSIKKGEYRYIAGAGGGGGALNYAVNSPIQTRYIYNLIIGEGGSTIQIANGYNSGGAKYQSQSGGSTAGFGLSANGGGAGGDAWTNGNQFNQHYGSQGAGGVGGDWTMTGGYGNTYGCSGISNYYNKDATIPSYVNSILKENIGANYNGYGLNEIGRGGGGNYSSFYREWRYPDSKNNYTYGIGGWCDITANSNNYNPTPEYQRGRNGCIFIINMRK